MHSHLRGYPELITALSELERLKPDAFEIYLERKRSTKIESKDQSIDSLAQSEDVGLSIRIVRDHRMGFSYTTSLQPELITRAALTAYEMAAHMPADDLVSLRTFGELAYPSVENYDEKGLGVPLAEKVAAAKELERLCRSQDKRIKTVRSAALGEGFYETHLIDQNGEHIYHRSSLFTASISCKAEEGDSAQMGGDFQFATEYKTLDLKSVAHLAAETATELLGAGAAPTMNCPAILRNNVVSELLDFLSSSFSAEQIDKGRSMMAGKQGERVFAESLTLIDDGLFPGGYGTSPFDGEGTPSRKTLLVDQGFMSSALYDVYYGRKFDKAPTGSAARGIKSPPSISFSNLYLKQGPKSLAQLCSTIDRGILIVDLMGVHTANPITGDFSLGASGLLIEKGKITRPVQGFAVAGNVLQLFRKVSDVGSDLRFFGNVGAPSLLVSEISVGGA